MIVFISNINKVYIIQDISPLFQPIPQLNFEFKFSIELSAEDGSSAPAVETEVDWLNCCNSGSAAKQYKPLRSLKFWSLKSAWPS
jgi:hypothetical protein